MIAGREAARSGEAKNSWLTGTASWAYVNISQHILGIRAHYDGLEIRPCLPDFINEFTAERIFRGARYVIHGRRTEQVAPRDRAGGSPDPDRRTPRIRVDGKLIEGFLVPANGNSELDIIKIEVGILIGIFKEETMAFQPDFLWGAGSSAYQTEGAWNEDGKGASIWDEFCHAPGKIKNDETGDTASDTWHRFETDLALIKELGLKAYRFSISWPRVLPEGRGALNTKGLVWYGRIVNSLLAAGVEPVITLYHWDLPLALERQGGWENRNTAEAFIEYAALIARHFDGRVKRYITLNEPQCFLGLGYGSGLHAPGKRLSGRALIQCVHHALLAHGGAVAAMRAACTFPP